MVDIRCDFHPNRQYYAQCSCGRYMCEECYYFSRSHKCINCLLSGIKNTQKEYIGKYIGYSIIVALWVIAAISFGQEFIDGGPIIGFLNIALAPRWLQIMIIIYFVAIYIGAWFAWFDELENTFRAMVISVIGALATHFIVPLVICFVRLIKVSKQLKTLKSNFARLDH